ncbi:hypothetical protein NA57DRAFT_74205 [Rhizodiscina lignyota]|uniref:DUF7708 domain-containing protein n=1 Tax=Rhizodiscina lignyota TaxID=1504668 RepID=A0A9P4M7M6_9PEZI|nr:hypothetical protein NA57DRAFT_74205 [Rhizodiscina lignyota]
MADPFSIIGLVDTAFGLGCNIYAFFSALSDAPSEIHSFAEELGVFNSVLQEVKDYVKVFKSSTFANQDELNLEIVGATLKQCNAEFSDIYDAIKDKEVKQSLSFLKRLGSSSSWVFDEDEREKSTQRLNRARQTLLLPYRLRQNIVIRDEVHYTREDIADLKDSQQEVLSLLSSMFAAGQERVKSLDSRADGEKVKSQTRLGDLSDKFQIDFDTFSSGTTTSFGATDAQMTMRTREKLDDPNLADEPPAATWGEVPKQIAALQDELVKFRSRLSSKDLKDLRSFFDIRGPQDLVDSLPEQTANTDRKPDRKVQASLLDLMKSTQQFGEMMSAADASLSAPLWGSLKLIIQASSQWRSEFDSVIEMIQEFSDAMRVCEREYKLYPNSMTKDPLIKLYSEFLEFCRRNMSLLQQPANARFRMAIIADAQRKGLQESISRIRKISATVVSEAEFQSRLELRDAHKRILAMELEQQKILAAMEEQKKILASLAEEQKLITMMKDQQMILQTLQQLQMKLQAPRLRDVLKFGRGANESHAETKK